MSYPYVLSNTRPIKLIKLHKLIKLPKLIKLKTQNINPTYETHWGQGKFTFALPPM